MQCNLAIIYEFEVIPGFERQFLDAWKELTQLILDYGGSMGSRLHEVSEGRFIAYAQWPDRQTWEASGSKLPEHSSEVRSRMRTSCSNIRTLHELDVVEDLLIFGD